MNAPEAPEGHVLVGIDGSAASVKAARWAVGHRKPLANSTAIAVFGRHEAGLEVDDVPTAPTDQGTTRSQALMVLEKVLLPELADLLTGAEVAEGQAGHVLVQRAESAELLVLGSRSSTNTVTHLAPVSDHCAKHCPVPVVIVPEHTPVLGAFDRIVVGVDGSENSIDALHWAARHASAGATIVAAAAWPATSVKPMATTIEATRCHIDQLADRAISDALASSEDLDTDRTIAVEVAHLAGQPAELLRTQSSEADLLVLGTSSRHGLDFLTHGSPTTRLLHHPDVPTVLVPPGFEHWSTDDRVDRAVDR